MEGSPKSVEVLHFAVHKKIAKTDAFMLGSWLAQDGRKEEVQDVF